MKTIITNAIDDMENLFYEITPDIETVDKNLDEYGAIQRITNMIQDEKSKPLSKIKSLIDFNIAWLPDMFDPKDQERYNSRIATAKSLIE